MRESVSGRVCVSVCDSVSECSSVSVHVNECECVRVSVSESVSE